MEEFKDSRRMKLLLIPILIFLTGCANTSTGWSKGTSLLESGPNWSPITAASGSDFRDSRALIHTSRGSALVGVQGNTVSIIQTSRK